MSQFTQEDFEHIKNRHDLIDVAKAKGIRFKKYLRRVKYDKELRLLQAELVTLQQWIAANKMRVAVIFEGRDAAGKGGAIKRFVEHLNPRSMRVVALSKPTETEQGQWYFRRYIKELPEPGEIVFFDRSWYNRAVVEPVMGFCTKSQYEHFMIQVPEFEHMLYADGIVVIKFWFSVSKEVQKDRFEDRLSNPLKRWKFSPVDMKGQELWNDYTFYKEQMFAKTHTTFSPWIIIRANSKKTARLESIRHVLSRFSYEDKENSEVNLLPDPNIVTRFYRHIEQIDI
ncbi:MAG: polyphosphate kinase 2 [Spirosomaceae bacterium]|nr:polyphosphate kinase 2 [Spirosomataceae bacterium]